MVKCFGTVEASVIIASLQFNWKRPHHSVMPFLVLLQFKLQNLRQGMEVKYKFLGYLRLVTASLDAQVKEVEYTTHTVQVNPSRC